MKNRNPIAVFFLSVITLGIYSIYWMVVTKGEMNKRGATIPTAWLIIVPFVNIWWYWKYSEGVGQVTNHKMDPILAFILLFLLNSIGEAIIQMSFNQIDSPVQPAPTPPAPETPVAPATPTPPTTPV